MRLVVMKFGGTSVEDGTAIDRTAKIVAGRIALGQQPIVVVSAMAKVTDQLLSVANAAARGDRAGALAISARLRCRHRDTACALCFHRRRRRVCTTDRCAFDALDEVLRGLAAICELTVRISDLVVSYGERLSSKLVTTAFRERGEFRRRTWMRATSSSPTRSIGKAVPQDEVIEQRCGHVTWDR